MLKDLLLSRLEELEVNINEKLMILEKNLKDHIDQASGSIKENINSLALKMDDCVSKLSEEHQEIAAQIASAKKMLTVVLLLELATLALLATLFVALITTSR